MKTVWKQSEDVSRFIYHEISKNDDELEKTTIVNRRSFLRFTGGIGVVTGGALAFEALFGTESNSVSGKAKEVLNRFEKLSEDEQQLLHSIMVKLQELEEGYEAENQESDLHKHKEHQDEEPEEHTNHHITAEDLIEKLTPEEKTLLDKMRSKLDMIDDVTAGAISAHLFWKIARGFVKEDAPLDFNDGLQMSFLVTSRQTLLRLFGGPEGQIIAKNELDHLKKDAWTVLLAVFMADVCAKYFRINKHKVLKGADILPPDPDKRPKLDAPRRRWEKYEVIMARGMRLSLSQNLGLSASISPAMGPYAGTGSFNKEYDEMYEFLLEHEIATMSLEAKDGDKPLTDEDFDKIYPAAIKVANEKFNSRWGIPAIGMTHPANSFGFHQTTPIGGDLPLVADALEGEFKGNFAPMTKYGWPLSRGCALLSMAMYFGKTGTLGENRNKAIKNMAINVKEFLIAEALGHLSIPETIIRNIQGVVQESGQKIKAAKGLNGNRNPAEKFTDDFKNAHGAPIVIGAGQWAKETSFGAFGKILELLEGGRFDEMAHSMAEKVYKIYESMSDFFVNDEEYEKFSQMMTDIMQGKRSAEDLMQLAGHRLDLPSLKSLVDQLKSFANDFSIAEGIGEVAAEAEDAGIPSVTDFKEQMETHMDPLSFFKQFSSEAKPSHAMEESFFALYEQVQAAIPAAHLAKKMIIKNTDLEKMSDGKFLGVLIGVATGTVGFSGMADNLAGKISGLELAVNLYIERYKINVIKAERDDIRIGILKLCMGAGCILDCSNGPNYQSKQLIATAKKIDDKWTHEFTRKTIPRKESFMTPHAIPVVVSSWIAGNSDLAIGNSKIQKRARSAQ